VLLQAFRIDSDIVIGSDIVRLDGGGFMPRCSARRLLAHPGVRPARVRVADVGGEEFDIAPPGLLTAVPTVPPL
jgi:hypothetical protein